MEKTMAQKIEAILISQGYKLGEHYDEAALEWAAEMVNTYGRDEAFGATLLRNTMVGPNSRNV